MKTRFFLVATMLITLAACSKDNEINDVTDGQPVALGVTGAIDGMIETRAVDNKWSYKDKIGISGTSGSLTYENLGYDYVDNTSGEFNPSTTAVYYGADKGTFTAYYPYTATTAMIDEKINGDITRQGSQDYKKIDYLFAPATKGTKTSPNVNFQFAHKMSKLILHMRPGDGLRYGTSESNFANYKFILSKLHSKVTFDPKDGTVEATGDIKDLTFQDVEDTNESNINPSSEYINDFYYYTVLNFILCPETVTGGIQLSIINTEKNVTYTTVLKTDDEIGDMVMTSGKRYDYTVKVNKTGLTISNAQITDWVREWEDGKEVNATI